MLGRERAAFRRMVYAYYRRHGRDLPWRRTRDAYCLLVSEVMLQQTQVERVLPKYRAFLREFPNVRALSAAPVSAALRAWQGLGYNRRAKFLHEAAKIIMRDFGGRFPKNAEVLAQLPGVGRYTAGAIACFAFCSPEVFIETNIRTVFLHHFFKNKKKVPDSALLPLIAETLDRKNPREWYYALMDYGVYLKNTEGNQNRRSAHYAKQSKFAGSNRQLRGLILKTVLAEKSITASALAHRIKKSLRTVRSVADALAVEGLFRKSSGRYQC